MHENLETSRPCNWESFVLLLIDVQKDFWNEETAAAFPDFEKNTRELLEFCRGEEIDIVHLRAEFKRDGSDWMTRYKLKEGIPCIEGTSGADVLPFATERERESVIAKQTFDGFYNPALQAWLEDNNKQFVLVAGLISSVCVLLTAASAAQRGYLVAVVEDCCADSPDAHKQTMEGYPFMFERVQSNEIALSLKKWRSDLEKLEYR